MVLHYRLGDPDDPGRRRLSAAMISYWAQFAYSGDPGKGRDGSEVRWTAWDSTPGKDKLILFDAASDGGIRMSSEEVTEESIQNALRNDQGFQNQQLHHGWKRRCSQHTPSSPNDGEGTRGE